MANKNLATATSSTVEAYGYVAATSSTLFNLFVQFKSGKIYRYEVPNNVVQEMDAAPSKGKYVNQMKKLFVGVLTDDAEVNACFGAVTQNESPRKVYIHAEMAMKFPILDNFF